MLGNTANVYLDLGQSDRAIDLNRQSLKLAEDIAYTAQVAFAQQNLAAALSRIPRPEEALAFYQSALATFRKIDRRAQIPYTLVSIGTLQGFVPKDPDRGRATLLEALAAALATRIERPRARSSTSWPASMRSPETCRRRWSGSTPR